MASQYIKTGYRVIYYFNTDIYIYRIQDKVK